MNQTVQKKRKNVAKLRRRGENEVIQLAETGGRKSGTTQSEQADQSILGQINELRIAALVASLNQVCNDLIDSSQAEQLSALVFFLWFVSFCLLFVFFLFCFRWF